MFFWGHPQFDGVREQAANIGWQKGNYTEEMFQTDYPQFFTKATEESPATPLLPLSMLTEFIAQANASIQPDKWLTSWRMACGLYVAHYATLYLRTYSDGSDTPAQAAATGALVGVVKSATLGDSAVSYDTTALTKATENWGDLNATQYGQMLATKARLAGLGGTYVL